MPALNRRCRRDAGPITGEKIVAEKATDTGLKKGVKLLFVDINGIEYPEEIKDKINKQMTAHLDVKIRQDEARAKKLIAEYEAQALEIEVESKRKAKLIEAESEERAAKFQANTVVSMAQAESVREKAKMKVRAEYYKQIVEELRQQGQSDETIKAILENLVSSTALEDQLHKAIGLATQIQKQAVYSNIPKPSNSG